MYYVNINHVTQSPYPPPPHFPLNSRLLWQFVIWSQNPTHCGLFKIYNMLVINKSIVIKPVIVIMQIVIIFCLALSSLAY